LGADARKTEIAELIGELTNARGVYERSDVDVREKEGLASSVGVLRGDAPPDLIEICENNFSLLVDVKRGHKTGLYLDQRENRARVARDLEGLQRPSRSAEILNVFSYTGGFSVYLGASNADARIINLDASRDALELARANMRANDCEARGEFVEGDAFVVLRKYRDQGRSFDALILDPPKFVHAQSQLESGLRGYKDINLLAFKLLKPGGALVTFSCSGQVSAQMFQTVVFQAATDAHRDAQIIAKLSQSSDHPILLAFPESEYLKGLVCRVM
jgi:23S rRNA (cytosine1962-C5)-methyltransferase